jgi:hypothetical protein
MGVLDEVHEWFAQERQGGVSGTVAALDPPQVPGGAFVHAVPARRVQHGEVLKLRIGFHHARGDVEQLQVLGVAFAAVMLAVELLRHAQAGCKQNQHQTFHDGDSFSSPRISLAHSNISCMARSSPRERFSGLR